MHQQVGGDHDVEGRLEGLHELVGQLGDEADGVGQQHGLATGQLQTTRRGVERGEQAVLDQHPGVGDPVEQGGLAGVGVADDRDGVETRTLARLALRRAGFADVAEVGFELVESALDTPAVDLELRLARTTRTDEAAGLLAELVALAAQPRQLVAQLGQLDLGLAFLAVGVLREDVEDHGGAIERGTTEVALEVALLCRGQLVVEHDGVGVDVVTQLA